MIERRLLTHPAISQRSTRAVDTRDASYIVHNSGSPHRDLLLDRSGRVRASERDLVDRRRASLLPRIRRGPAHTDGIVVASDQ